MGDTIAQIATKALEYGYGGPDDTTRLKAFVVADYLDLFYSAKWSWAENLTTLTLAAGASSVAVPTGVYQYGEIRKITSPANLTEDPPEFVPYDEKGDLAFVNYQVINTGRPTKYSLFAGTAYFDRIADTQYIYQFYRWNSPVAADLEDGDEPLVPEYAREILLWGALMRQAARDRDMNMVSFFAARREEKLMQLKEADIQGRPRSRARMPDEYGNAYD